MTELIDYINDLCVKFKDEALKNACGNKAAGVRARKISLEMEKSLKEYRKRSLNKD